MNGTDDHSTLDGVAGDGRLRRAGDGRALAGVAAGLARHLGIDPLMVRLAFILMTLSGGIGLAAYIVLWLLLPAEPATPGRPVHDLRLLSSYAAITVGLGILIALSGAVSSLALWPLAVGGVGGAVLWQQADPERRQRWMRSTSARVRDSWVRNSVGVLLVVGGVVGFLVGSHQVREIRQSLGFTAVILIGLGIVVAPWVMGLVRQLYEERSERIRSQERAEMAAHLHDSVLHTLTLIQRNADDSREVQRLARVQERELRTWLYQPRTGPLATLSAGVEETAARAEEEHGVPIEAVCVGECPLTEPLNSTLQAAREAMVNAAKYSGADSISVFAEVDEATVTIFVRDRGKGFDLDAIPDDRMGVRESIVGRMQRNGGTADIRTAPGQGTEVTLRMARSD